MLIHTSSRIVSVDPQRAEILFEQSNVVRGDVLIGADGVRSICRKAVAGPEFDSFPYGKSAFRFMVPRAKVLEDPETRELGEVSGSLDMFFSPQNKVIMYPCVDDTLLNIVCIHPSQLSEASAETYNQSVSRDKVLEVFHEFDRRILKIFEKCDSDTLKVWPLLDAPNLPKFVNDHLALIGDAAHPFTPFIGQGGAMAIEDAAAITVMLSKGVKVTEVPERLKLYDQARLKRATLIQGYSRIAGGDGVKPGEEKAAKMRGEWTRQIVMTLSIDPCSGREHSLYALGHDETHASQQLLRQFMWRKATGARWRQPVAFGPFPRGTHSGAGSGSRTTTVSIKFKTSGTLLRNLLPNTSYSFSENDTVALASFSIRSCQNVELLGGHRFHQVSFKVHGVQYKESDGSFVQGQYLPVSFEDSADAISFGREHFGYPSVFSDIDLDWVSTDYIHVNVSWKGVKWASFWIKDLKEQPSPNGTSKAGPAVEEGIFVHRYVPTATDDCSTGHVDAEYDIFLSNPSSSSEADENNHSHINGNTTDTTHERSYRSSSNAGFEIMAPEKSKLPTLHHIVDRLRELPVFDIVEATMKDEESSLYPASAIRLT